MKEKKKILEQIAVEVHFGPQCRNKLGHMCRALRTHLINMSPVQTELSWPAFVALRKKWAGKV